MSVCRLFIYSNKFIHLYKSGFVLYSNKELYLNMQYIMYIIIYYSIHEFIVAISEISIPFLSSRVCMGMLALSINSFKNILGPNSFCLSQTT